jgi:hypothetical protein
MQKLFRSLIAVGGLAGLVACGDDVTVGGPDFTISGAPVTAIQVGAKVQLSANEAATWTTSAASVATVDATGLVTAVGAGSASITATSTANTNRKASVTITVTAPAVRNVTVSPSSAILKPGDTQGFVANVDADPGVARTVTWASSNTAVATVTAAGVVTAVTPGAVTITATSTANTTVSGAASVTVRTPLPATISVQNITVTGNQNQTVNVNNVAGSIDVNMNVDPGEQVVQRVEVLIDGNVACTQNLSGAQSESMRIAAAFDNIEDVVVSCQINTAAFAAATGIANFPNGPHTLSVRAIIAGGNDVATPSTPLIFNNQSGVLAVITNNNGSDPASAINPGTGIQWIGGGITMNVTGVSYVAGTTVASVSCNVLGKTAVIALTAGLGSVAYTESSTSNWSATNTSVSNYLSPQAGETANCTSATLSNGQPMPNPGTIMLNFGPFPGQQSNASMPVLQVIRLDNNAPGVAPSGWSPPAQATVASTLQAGGVVTPWVNAASTLTPSATGSVGTFNVLGLPSLAVLNAPATSPDQGVDNILVGVWVPAAGGALPTTGGTCNVTGLTSVTTGNQLAETTVSSAYPVRLVFRDALGNQFCFDLGGLVGGQTAIGADFTAPTGTITGPAANTGYDAALPNWAVTASDNASGFTSTPLRVAMNRLNAAGSNACVLGGGTAPACTATSQQALTFSATGGSTTDGYYTTTINLTDAAGNSLTLVSGQLNELDQVDPAFSGGISLPAVIAGAATNTFTTTVTDQLDLGSIFGVVDYPGIGLSIQYPTQAIGTFGSPLEQTSTNLGYAVANWIRCLNAPGSFATASNPPSQITLSLTDQSTIAPNVVTLSSAAFGANAQACTGTVGNLGGTAVPNSFVENAPNYGTGNTQVDLDGVSVATGSSTTVALQAVADVPLNSSADPCSRVDFFWVNGTVLNRIGTGAATLAQTQTNRTYTYNFTWDPAPPVPTGSVPVTAVCVDAQGDAVATLVQNVTIVP